MDMSPRAASVLFWINVLCVPVNLWNLSFHLYHENWLWAGFAMFAGVWCSTAAVFISRNFHRKAE